MPMVRCKPAAGRFPTPREVEDQYGRRSFVDAADTLRAFLRLENWNPPILVTYSLFLISASAGGDQHFGISPRKLRCRRFSHTHASSLELDLSQTAKMTYALLLDRATLSQKPLDR